jgi:uncharacterized protein DUF262/uncharacterized protein DUF1524
LKADPISVGKVLSENHRFVVPIYQRTYAWTEKRQLEALFVQIEAKAEERLQKGKVDFPHYMGSLLVIPEGEATFGRVQAFDIVDGQQRLTTFHLCYAAMRDVARRWGFDDLHKKFEGLLLHGDDEEVDEKHGRYKLQPTEFDRELFRRIVDLTSDELRLEYPTAFYKNGRIIKGKGPAPLAAYWFFLARTEGFIEMDETSSRKRFLALTDAIFQNFRFIVITLSKEDDPQVIFQTLNSGGEPLAAMDLVRNDVFLRAIRNGEDESQLMKKHWRVFEDAFWKADHTQGRLRKPLMDFFLAHALGAEMGELVSLTELYAEYKKFAKAKSAPTVTDELASITRYAPIYRELVSPEEDSPLYKLSQRLNIFDLSTAYPLILLIATSSAEPEVKTQIYDLIGSYVIRRALCGLTAKNYNIVFLGFVAYLRQHGVSVESFAAFAELRKDTDSARFPTDQEFREAVINRGQYGVIPTYRLRMLMEELEMASRDKFSAADGIQSNLTIEHIMPQNWYQHWSTLPSGRVAPPPGGLPDDEAMAAEIRERNRVIQTLANLALLTPPGNASASNGTFESKRSRLRDALLRMNLDIANSGDWTEHAIGERANRLADLAVKIWPAPAQP